MDLYYFALFAILLSQYGGCFTWVTFDLLHPIFAHLWSRVQFPVLLFFDLYLSVLYVYA